MAIARFIGRRLARKAIPTMTQAVRTAVQGAAKRAKAVGKITPKRKAPSKPEILGARGPLKFPVGRNMGQKNKLGYVTLPDNTKAPVKKDPQAGTRKTLSKAGPRTGTAKSAAPPSTGRTPAPYRSANRSTAGSNVKSPASTSTKKPDPYRTDYDAIAPRAKTANSAANAAKGPKAPSTGRGEGYYNKKAKEISPVGAAVGAGAAASVLYQMFQNLGNPKNRSRDNGNDGASLPKKKGKGLPDMKTASLDYLEARKRMYG
jgi:hypothetical protein